MSDNQLLEQLLEMLKEVQAEQKEQRELVIKLNTKFDNHQNDFDVSKAKIEVLETKVNKAEGITGFFKMFAGFMLGGVVSFAIWVNTELHRIDNQIIKIEQYQNHVSKKRGD